MNKLLSNEGDHIEFKIFFRCIFKTNKLSHYVDFFIPSPMLEYILYFTDFL